MMIDQLNMKFIELFVVLVGHLAWPIVVLLIAWKLIKELNSGLLAKIVRPGGTIEYAGMKLRVSEEVEKAQEDIVKAGLTIAPQAGEPQSEDFDENSTPYEIVMDAWADLADAITEVAMTFGGKNDRRQVWANAELLKEREIIGSDTVNAVRSLQSARNSIRYMGDVSIADAKSFSGSALPLTRYFEELADN
jgi:hypothetical protein